MPPLKGSHIAEDNNYCLQCHTTADSFEGDSKHAYVALDALKKDVHYQKGVNCVDCHGGDPAKQDAQAHQTDDFRSKLPQIEKYWRIAIRPRSSIWAKASIVRPVRKTPWGKGRRWVASSATANRRSVRASTMHSCRSMTPNRRLPFPCRAKCKRVAAATKIIRRPSCAACMVRG